MLTQRQRRLLATLGAVAAAGVLAACGGPSSAKVSQSPSSGVTSPGPSQSSTPSQTPNPAPTGSSVSGRTPPPGRPQSTPTKAPFLQTLGSYGAASGVGVNRVPKGATCAAHVTVTQGGSSSNITPDAPVGTPDTEFTDYPAVQFFFKIPDQPSQAKIVWSFRCELRDAKDPRYVVWEASKVLTFNPAPPPSSPATAPSSPPTQPSHS
jgi:hypothetical protein